MNDKKEIWKPVHIEKYENRYMISNFGNVKNAETNYVLSTGNLRSGYRSTTLYNNGKNKAFKVHILVANAFLEKPKNKNKKWVNHKDGNKLNNHIDNLEWVTPRENVIHGFKTGLIKSLERKVCQYTKEGNLIKTFNSIKEAYEETGIRGEGIVKVCRGYRNTAGGYVWKYFKIYDREKLDENKPKLQKQIKDFPNYYVTDDGRVLSKRYKKYLKPHKNADGYFHVQLNKVVDGKRITKDYLIHRLIALAFIDNPENKPTINHINSIKTDNRLENLEWTTHSENAFHKNFKSNKIL